MFPYYSHLLSDLGRAAQSPCFGCVALGGTWAGSGSAVPTEPGVAFAAPEKGEGSAAVRVLKAQALAGHNAQDGKGTPAQAEARGNLC